MLTIIAVVIVIVAQGPGPAKSLETRSVSTDQQAPPRQGAEEFVLGEPLV